VPKRVHEIKGFHRGTITVPSERDIPDDSASYSLNVDPVTEDGVLRATFYDTEVPLAASGSDTANMTGAENNDSSTLTVTDNSDLATSGNGHYIDSLGRVQKIAWTGKPASTVINGVSGALGSGKRINGGTLYETSEAVFNADKIAMINDNGTRDLVYFDNADSKVKKVNDINHDTIPPSEGDVSSSAESVTGTPTMVTNNKEVHIGMGNSQLDKPLWCGYHSKGQFGANPSTSLELVDAELQSPSFFPSFHKTVNYGNYVYGIEQGGRYLYYIDTNTGNYNSYVSNLVFTSTKALAIDHNNYLMVVDNNDTIVWIDVSTTAHSVVKTYGITQAGTETSHDFTDIIETNLSSTYYIWLAKSGGHTYHGEGQVNSPTANVGRGLLQMATAPTGTSGTLTFADKTPWQGHDTTLSAGAEPYVGAWFKDSGGSVPCNAAIIPYTKATLVRVGPSNIGWVGWLCEFVVEDAQTTQLRINFLNATLTSNVDLVELADMNGPVMNLVSPGYTPVYDSGTFSNNDADEEKWFPVRLKTTSSSTDIIGKYGAEGDLTSAVLQSSWDNIISVYSHAGGHLTDDRIILATNTANSGGVSSLSTKLRHLTYVDATPSAGGGDTMIKSHWYCTSDGGGSGSWAHNSVKTVYRFAKGSDTVPTFEYSTDQAKVSSAIISSVSTGFTYSLFLNSGSGNGKLATISSTGTSNFSSWTKRQQSPLDITLSQTDMASGDFNASHEYWYKASFIYDGFQESPLGISWQLSSPQAKHVELTLKLHTDSLSKRITSVAIYRAQTETNGGTEPDGFYRLVKVLDLDTSWTFDTDATWGTARTKTFIDTFTLGASYEGRTGISEVLDFTTPNYSLSTELNSHLFVTKCHHQLIEGASNYLFKSKPYNYNQFNWINDFLKLPTTPTAIASFKGRIYVFDENNTYRIEPNSLYIEDVVEGAGCLDQTSVAVTDYGMCYADKNFIYLHDGNFANPISVAISKGDTTYSWQNIDTSYKPKIVFMNKLKSFLIVFKTTATNGYYAWVYNLLKKRWDLWQPFEKHGASPNSSEPKGFILGKNGEVLFSCNNKMFQVLGDPDQRKGLYWTSKKITLGQNTQIKRFNNFSVVGDMPTENVGTVSSGVSVKIDGNDVTESPNDGAYGWNNFTTNSQSGKYVEWVISNFAGSKHIDALGIVYRRKVPNAETVS